MKHTVAWTLGWMMLLVRWTCRVKFHEDPRPELRRRGIRFTYAGGHAQQLGCVMSAERGCAALVSRSKDGDIAIPLLRLCGFQVVRGSGGRAKKGGAKALQNLIGIVSGGTPAAITVDGPRGPRGVAKPGIGVLAVKTGALVIPVYPRIRHRWVFKSSWDRLQVPFPFARIDVYFGTPIDPNQNLDATEISSLVETSLHEMELLHDPHEAQFSDASLTSTPAIDPEPVDTRHGDSGQGDSGQGETTTPAPARSAA